MTNVWLTFKEELKNIIIDSFYNTFLLSLVIEYEGLQLKREFYSPQYQTAQRVTSRIPDFRNVLYWSPGLETSNGKQDISFYTSDIQGKYTVLIQGISSSGLAGFATTTFTVSAELK